MKLHTAIVPVLAALPALAQTEPQTLDVLWEVPLNSPSFGGGGDGGRGRGRAP